MCSTGHEVMKLEAALLLEYTVEKRLKWHENQFHPHDTQVVGY